MIKPADTMDSLLAHAGLNKARCAEILAQVQENQARLASCRLHAFDEKVEAMPFGSKWRCTACGGVVDIVALTWYQRGVAHGQKGEAA